MPQQIQMARQTSTVNQDIKAAEKLEEVRSLVPKIKEEHRAVMDAMEKGLDHALRCGEYLTQAKKLVGHGRWKEWVGQNCGFGKRTAENYMKVFREREKLPQRDDVSYRKAVSMLRMKHEESSGSTTGKKKGKRGKLTISKKKLTEAIVSYYADVQKNELIALLKAIGVVVK